LKLTTSTNWTTGKPGNWVTNPYRVSREEKELKFTLTGLENGIRYIILKELEREYILLVNHFYQKNLWE